MSVSIISHFKILFISIYQFFLVVFYLNNILSHEHVVFRNLIFEYMVSILFSLNCILNLLYFIIELSYLVNPSLEHFFCSHNKILHWLMSFLSLLFILVYFWLGSCNSLVECFNGLCLNLQLFHLQIIFIQSSSVFFNFVFILVASFFYFFNS